MRTEDIYEITYTDWRGNPQTERAGTFNCVKIVEHPAMGEGDRWFYDIYYNDMSVLRVFKFDSIRYKRDS